MFKIPEKWCVKVTEKTRNIIGDWIKGKDPMGAVDIDMCCKLLYNTYPYFHYPIVDYSGDPLCCMTHPRDGYKEISFDDFNKIVLLEQAKEKYPVGTKFYPNHIQNDTDYCIITDDSEFQIEEDQEANIISMIKGTCKWTSPAVYKEYGNTTLNRVVFNDSEWAKKVEQTEPKQEIEIGDQVYCGGNVCTVIDIDMNRDESINIEKVQHNGSIVTVWLNPFTLKLHKKWEPKAGEWFYVKTTEKSKRLKKGDVRKIDRILKASLDNSTYIYYIENGFSNANVTLDRIRKATLFESTRQVAENLNDVSIKTYIKDLKYPDVIHVKGPQKHKEISRYHKLTDYNYEYHYYLIGNRGYAKTRKEYECNPYKIHEFEDLIFPPALINSKDGAISINVKNENKEEMPKCKAILMGVNDINLYIEPPTPTSRTGEMVPNNKDITWNSL